MTGAELAERLYDRLRQAEGTLEHVRSERDRLMVATEGWRVKDAGWRVQYDDMTKRAVEAEAKLEAGKPSVTDCMDPWVCCVHTPAEAELDPEEAK